MKRTAKDEQDYNVILRREGPIKSEVIVELRRQNKALWENQVRLLEDLVRSADALRLYRLQALAIAKAALDSESHCVPGCAKHAWDDSDGWHMSDEVKHGL